VSSNWTMHVGGRRLHLSLFGVAAATWLFGVPFGFTLLIAEMAADIGVPAAIWVMVAVMWIVVALATCQMWIWMTEKP